MISDWPQQRSFPFSSVPESSCLNQAWDFSSQRIRELSTRLHDNALSRKIACVAVSGSLARMEAHPGSDVDLMVVIDDRSQTVTDADAENLFTIVWQLLDSGESSQALKTPKPGGVFSECVMWSRLVDSAVRGIVNEDVTSYGQRMQLLLDAQPIFRHESFDELQTNILHWYSETRVQQLFQETGPFHWLWQDVQRYWRSIRARACWLHADEPAKSLAVNAKLRSSRLVLIAAFLRAIENAENGHASFECVVESLRKQLHYTPLERIVMNMVSSDDSAALVNAYQIVWKFVTKISATDFSFPPAQRQALRDLSQLIGRSIVRDNPNWSL